MNGIRGTTSTSPPHQVSGQQQQRNFSYSIVAPEDYLQGFQSQSQPQQQYQVPIGIQSQNYDINKTGFGATRMPSPSLGQQQTNMYPQQQQQQQQQPQQQQQQQQQQMRPTAPFFQPNQPNVRPQRYSGPPNPSQNVYMAPSIMYVNQGQFQGQGPLLGNSIMIQSNRMPTFTIPNTQQGLYNMPPQQPITSYPSQGFGNPPINYSNFYNPNITRPPTSTGQSAPQPKKKNILKIVDPTTMKDISAEILSGQKQASHQEVTQDSGSRSTPVQSVEQQHPQSQPNIIADEFARQVAAKLGTPNAPTHNMQHPPHPQQAAPSHGAPPPASTPQSIGQPPPQPTPPSHIPPPSSTPQSMVQPPPQSLPPVFNPATAPEFIQRVPGQQHMGPRPAAPVNFQAPPPTQPGVTMPNMHPDHADKPAQKPSVAQHPQQQPPQQPPPQQPVASDSMHNVETGTNGVPGARGSSSDSVSGTKDTSQSSLSNGSSQKQSSQSRSPSSEPASKPSTGAGNKPATETASDSTKSSSKPNSAVVIMKPGDGNVSPVQTQARGEPVTVSVEQSSTERTNNVKEKTPPSDSAVKTAGSTPNLSREATPEVHVVPPTPVEKEPNVEVAKEVEEHAQSSVEVAVPKKDKAKKKMKELNKKGEKMGGSVFDAYTDSSPPPQETDSTPSTKTPVSEKENAEAVTKPAEPAREATPPEKEPSPSNETIPTVEINEPEKEAEEELEEGEIRDDVDEDDPEAMLRYKYLEDQWSPLNPEGKKHYDREFLLQFQFEDTATSKPAGLPDIPDIILDKPLTTGRQFSRELQSNAGSQNFIDFTPNYVWPAGGQGGGGQRSRGLPRQPSNQGKKQGGQGGPPPRQINLSISKDIELHRAKEAWKPGKKTETAEDADPKTEELYKKTRSILNKLTPQKFQTLVTQMQSLPIDSENKLKGVIDLVFEKAVSEPNFSVAYANMCRCLSMFKVPSETKPGEMVNFRAVLLTRCQREFEKDKSSEAHFTKLRGELEKAEESKKAELRSELEYQEMMAKRRSLGNIRFIGELFKLKMLTENIMHDCVFKLLRTKDSENLECLCRLLTTIGKELDTEKAKNRVDQYFQQMSKIVHDKKSPMTSRVKFMLQDVMELRLSKWVPRRVDNNPKTIDQIHKEVQQEAQEKALASQQAQFNKPARGSGGGGGGGGRRGPPEQRGGMGSDGWNTVSRTPLKVDRSIDPSKMKFSKQNTDETSIQLGPGGGASRFAGWGRGSTGGSMGRSSMEKEKTPSTPANRFSALSKPEEDSSRRYGGSSPARGEGRGRGFRPPSLNARRSQESDRERAVAAAKAIGSRNSVDGGIERERESRSRVEAPRPAGPAEISKDDMEKKTTAILDEYLHIQDMKEAVLCVKELNTANHLHFVLHSINHVLERSNVARKQTGHLLHDLVKQQIISADSYINGLVEVLEFAEDLEIDIPMIWKYYGELISPMIQDGSVPLSFLKKACKPLMESNKAGKLLAEVLKDASHREGHKKVGGLWTDSGLQWSDFIPKNQVEQFLTDNKLEFTKGGDSVPTTPTTGLPLLQIAEKLEELIVDQHKDNETVFDWIESNVDEPTTKKPKFIRALMTAVCKSAIKGDAGKEKVEQKEIAGRNDLLQKYLDHQPDSELQALYAIQALVTKLEHPQGMLRVMFDTLYDDDIISEDAFIQWEKSEEETEGKGAALKQVVQFFTWLREAEDDS